MNSDSPGVNPGITQYAPVHQQQGLAVGECCMRVTIVSVVTVKRQVTSSLSHGILLWEVGTRKLQSLMRITKT